MPVTWDELTKALKRKKIDHLYFDPKAALARLEKTGDLFAGVLQLKESRAGASRRGNSSREQARRADCEATSRIQSQAELFGYGGTRRFHSATTCSTYMAQLTTVKDVQAHLRHSSSATTLEHYIKSVPESVRVAVESLDHLLKKAPADSGQPAN